MIKGANDDTNAYNYLVHIYFKMQRQYFVEHLFANTYTGNSLSGNLFCIK